MEHDTKDAKDTKGQHVCRGWCCGCHSKGGAIGWGVFFIVIGGYFVAEELGYISTELSIWTVLLVAFGLYLVVKGLVRK